MLFNGRSQKLTFSLSEDDSRKLVPHWCKRFVCFDFRIIGTQYLPKFSTLFEVFPMNASLQKLQIVQQHE